MCIRDRGYFAGIFPPGKKNPQLAVETLKNLLISHTRVYNALKSLPNGKESSIGIVKNIMQFDPYRRWNIFDWIVCRITSKIYNGIALSYLKSGTINVNYKFFLRMNYKSDTAALATTLFRLNYYINQVHLLISSYGVARQDAERALDAAIEPVSNTHLRAHETLR